MNMETLYALRDNMMGKIPTEWWELMADHQMATGAGMLYIMALIYLMYALLVTVRILISTKLWLVKSHAFEHISILGAVLLVNVTLIIAINRAPDPFEYIVDVWIHDLIFVPSALAAFAYISTARHLVKELNVEDCLVTAGVELNNVNVSLNTTIKKLNEENSMLRSKVDNFVEDQNDRLGEKKL